MSRTCTCICTYSKLTVVNPDLKNGCGGVHVRRLHCSLAAGRHTRRTGAIVTQPDGVEHAVRLSGATAPVHANFPPSRLHRDAAVGGSGQRSTDLLPQRHCLPWSEKQPETRQERMNLGRSDTPTLHAKYRLPW